MSWWRAHFPVIAIPAILFVLASALDLWTSTSLTKTALYASAGLLALDLTALGCVHLALKWVLHGKLGLVNASRYTYLLALWSASATILIGGGIVYALLAGILITRILGFYWPEFVYGMAALFFIFSAFGLWKVLPSTSPLAEDQPLRAWGALASRDTQPELFAVIDRLSASLRLERPPHILLSTEPSVFYRKQSVAVDSANYDGGVLLVSVTLCRLLSEAEMMALVAVELLMAALIPQDWSIWLMQTQQKWAPVRKRLENGSPIPRFIYGTLWYWLDQWLDWRALPLLISYRRAAILTGKENLASALAKATILGSKWPAFLAELQTALQRDSTGASQMNLCRAFAERIAELAPQLAEALVGGCEGNDEEWAALHSCIDAIGIDVSDLVPRIAALPADPALAWLAGIEEVEAALSRSRIRMMFFLPDEGAA